MGRGPFRPESVGVSTVRFEELPWDVQLELSDPFFNDRTHGKKPTYQAGCHGPLCRKNERDTKRREYLQKMKAAGRIVQTRRPRASQARDPELELIQRWHESLGRELEEAS